MRSPVLGFRARERNGGIFINSVEINSPAEKAGLKQGDLITKIDSDAPRNIDFRKAAGKTLKLTVVRGGGEQEIPMTVGSRDIKDYELVEMPQLSAAQLKGWLKR